MNRIVACCGTFDGDIHPGHVSFLQTAKRHGDVLIVFVNTDAVVRRNKTRVPIYSQAERITHVQGQRIADKVLAFHGDDSQNLRQIQRQKPDVFCLSEGNNYPFDKQIEQTITQLGGQIVKIPRLGEYSTTRLHFS